MQRLVLLPLAVLLSPAPISHAGVAAVWAVSDGEKVAKDDRNHPLRSGNAIWNGKAVELVAARNEIVAFQVIVEADEAGVGTLRIALPELRSAGSRIVYSPPAVDPSLFADRPIQLFSVNQMRVAEETHAEWIWDPKGPAKPKKTVGWQPVQLVPENAKPGKGGFPLKAGASEVQAFWVEIYTGRDRPKGTYAGTLTVTADDQKRELPVTLRLLDFDLPDANSLDVMVYYEPSQPEEYQGRNLDAAYHRFAHRHRVELVHAYDETKVRGNAGRFSGADFTKAQGYEGPGESAGNKIAPLTFYGPGAAFRDKEVARRRSDDWMRFFSQNLKGARTFLYLPDEPYPAQYAEVRAFAETIRTNAGPGGKLPLFITKRVIPEFQGLIDIWCIPPQYLDLPKVAEERAKGNSVCFYNGGRPQGPAIVIDAPATEARVIPWAAFKHGIDLYFYWHGDHWRHNSQKQGERRQDVWGNPITFDNRGQPKKPIEDQGYINGDGVLLYPGEEKLHPDEDRGIAGPIGTIQLANLRRGLQDHQYLTLARRLGLEAEVRLALEAIVPRVFSDAGETVSFPETGEPFERVRRVLGAAIESARKK